MELISETQYSVVQSYHDIPHTILSWKLHMQASFIQKDYGNYILIYVCKYKYIYRLLISLHEISLIHQPTILNWFKKPLWHYVLIFPRFPFLGQNDLIFNWQTRSKKFKINVQDNWIPVQNCQHSALISSTSMHFWNLLKIYLNRLWIL